MKTINVRVTMQLDINGNVTIEKVQKALDYINTELSNAALASEPQIFVENIDKDDITEM